MKNIFLVSISLFLASCGGGSSTGAQVDESVAGDMVPDSFVGVYTGTLTVTAQAIGITESGTFPITVTVTDDGMIRFDGDDPEETFTTGLMNDGSFSGNLPIDEDPCEGVVGTVGMIVGNTVSGTLTGEGSCEEGILDLDVELDGTFSASM